jgi:hypothetical protein
MNAHVGGLRGSEEPRVITENTVRFDMRIVALDRFAMNRQPLLRTGYSTIAVTSHIQNRLRYLLQNCATTAASSPD